MDEGDLRLRNATYALFVELARAPSADEVATRIGTTTPGRQLAELAVAWWSDRLTPSWTPHTREQNQAILSQVDLTTPFWRPP